MSGGRRRNVNGRLGKQRKLKPLITDPPIFNPSIIERNPHYLSVEVGRLVSPASWLIHVFCKKILKLRAYYDAEVIKRLALYHIFSLYASYKVPNWIIRWGESKMFGVLNSGLTIYGEIIM